MRDRNPDENGWRSSAAAWIDLMGDDGDFSRAHVLDDLMLDLAMSSGPETALDVGCGEGRFAACSDNGASPSAASIPYRK